MSDPVPEIASETTEPPKSGSSLKLRVISAAVLAPIVLGLVWFGGWPFLALLFIVGPIMTREWADLAAPGGTGLADQLVVSLAILAVLAFSGFGKADIGLALACAIVGLGASAALWRGTPVLRLLSGAAYIGLPVISFAWLRSDPDYGLIALFWLLALVWATDISAYFSGKTIGGPKMAPRWSPNKTWAGLIGGVTGAVLVGVATAAWLGTSLWPLAIISGALAILSQVGDVTESALKRRAGVKDSGTLIPGHGGILDRVDGLMFAALGAAAIAMVRSGEVTGVLLWP